MVTGIEKQKCAEKYKPLPLFPPKIPLILYYYQQMHKYFTNDHTPTCFDTIVSSSGSLLSIPCQVTQVFQMLLLVIQFKIKMFHIGFMQVLILQQFNPLNPELNPICYLLALLGAYHSLHVSRIRVKLLTFRLLMSYIYIWSTHS